MWIKIKRRNWTYWQQHKWKASKVWLIHLFPCVAWPHTTTLSLSLSHTHTHTHTHTHKHKRIPISYSHRIISMSHRHAQFNPLRQNSHKHTALHADKAPPDQRMHKRALVAWRLKRRVLWLQGCQFESPTELGVEVMSYPPTINELPMSKTHKLQLTLVAPRCEGA